MMSESPAQYKMLKPDVSVTHSNTEFRLTVTQSFKDQVHCHSISSVFVSQREVPQLMTPQR